MDYPETLVALDTEDTGWRKQSKKNTKLEMNPCDRQHICPFLSFQWYYNGYYVHTLSCRFSFVRI